MAKAGLEQLRANSGTNFSKTDEEGVRLVSDLSHVRKALHDEQANSRQLMQRLEALQKAEQRTRVLEVQLTERTVLSERLTEQLATATAHSEENSRRVRELELSLATTQAKLEAQQALNEELRSYLKQQSRTEKDESK